MNEDVEIRPLRPEEAPALSDCFRRCYGDTYVAGFFYDPDAIRARMAGSGFHPVVAATGSGTIVGHMALTQRHAGALTVEAGNTVVDPAWRSQGLAARLGAALIEACRVSGYAGFHHYPTTAHPIMQKLAVQGGGVETGIMLAYIPEDTDYRELGGKADGRLAVVVVYQPILPAPPRQVHVPPAYADLLRDVYARAGLQRTLRTDTDARARTGARIDSRYDTHRRLLHVHVHEAGEDIVDRVDAHEHAGNADVTHVDLPLHDAAAAACVDRLWAAGFCFCCVLPEFSADGDVLRLQRIAGAARAARPSLVHDQAAAMLTLMLGECPSMMRDSRASV